MHRPESLAEKAAHKKPGAFLKALLLHLDSKERRQLYDNLAKAEREGKCIRRAVFLMVVLLLVAAAGLGYCALLLPEVFRDPTHLLMRGFYVLGLGSLISQAVFLGYLFWHRTTLSRLHAECRCLVLALARSQLKVPSAPTPLIPAAEPPARSRPDASPATPEAHYS